MTRDVFTGQISPEKTISAIEMTDRFYKRLTVDASVVSAIGSSLGRHDACTVRVAVLVQNWKQTLE
jgi:hypothetical protein